MQTINSSLIFGKLQREPNFSGGERPKASFTLVTAKPYKDQQGEWKEIAEYVPCTVWGRTVDTLRGCVEGDYFLVEGRITTRSWETEEGGKKYATEVNCQKVTVVQAKTAPQQPHNDEEQEKSIENFPF